jgi:hypothetical protein
MSNVKISQLPAATTPLAGTEVLPLVQGTTTAKVTVAQLRATSVTAVTGTAPVVSSGGLTPAISMAAASTSANGYLTSTDWNTFNGKQAAGAVTSVTGTSPVVSSGGATPAISIPAASTSASGYLTSTDWNTFNGKYSTGGALGTPSSGTATNLTGLPLTTGVTGTLPIANGGTGTTTPALVAGTNVTISGTWPNQTINSSGSGGVTSFDAGTTGLTPATATTGVVTLAGTLAVANGGTGTTTPALVAGTNVTISGTWPNQTINSSGGGGMTYPGAGIGNSTGTAWGTSYSTTGTGTVVALATSPTFVTPILGTPTSGVATNLTGLPLSTGVTGTLPILNGGTGQTTAAAAITALTGAQTSAYYLRSNGTNATLSALAAADLTGTVAIASGGTGQTTAAAAITALTGTQTSAYYLRSNGTNSVLAALAAADVTGTLAVANGGTGVTTSTGTGAVVLSTSPTLVTPLLGTPTSGVATNLTGLPLTTGVTGTLPVANGGTGVTTSTGSGNTVLSTSPTLVTPVLGTPSSGTLSSCTVDGTNSVGYLNVPVNSQSAAYTLVLADSGKAILHPSTDANARTFTIPANGTVAFAIGTAVTFINMTSQVVSIAITTDTLYLGGTGTTGTRSLAQYGTATAIKMTSTTWIINGSGLT